jgi:hypothetical protein
MLSQVVSQPVARALILSTPLLRTTLLAIPAVASVQARTCFTFFRHRHRSLDREKDIQWRLSARERFLNHFENVAIGKEQEAERKRHRDELLQRKEEAISEWQKKYFERAGDLWKAKMEKREELLKKWMEMEPYEVLFGRSERMLKGIKIKDWTAWALDSKSVESVPAKSQRAQESLRIQELAYDPVSGRMIKSDEVNHGQMDAAKVASANIEPESPKSNALVSELKPLSITSADRAKLEESFARVQNELAQSWTQISIPSQLRSFHKLSGEIQALGDMILQASQAAEASKATLAQPIPTQPIPAEPIIIEPTPAETSSTQAEALEQMSQSVKDLGQRLARISAKVAANKDSANVYPLIFGDKPLPKTEALKTIERDVRLDQEVQMHKEAMLRVEEEARDRDSRLTDTELTEELRRIYERAYGEITSPQDISAQPEQVVSTPKESAVYTVLAYDPSTSEVSTTTLSAPPMEDESSIALTVALTQLAEPAKFLPHLRLLRENNFRAISVTKNLLVLRGSPPVQDPTMTQTAADISSPPETLPLEPSGAANPKRVEPFYTGSRLHRRRFRRERRFWRDLLVFTIKFSMVTGAIIYILGLKDGMKKVPLRMKAPESEAKNEAKSQATGQGKSEA